MAIPKIRLDDWPTGVRPILPDYIDRFDIVLQEFEKRKIEYVLGIVPSLINQTDISYLKTLKYCIPAVHGWHHNHHNWNEKNTIEDVSLEGLKSGIKILSEIKEVEHYIPPFNNLTRDLVNKIIKCNFKYLHTGSNFVKRIDGITLITPRQFFYGRSSKIIQLMPAFNNTDILSLHLTWEYDEYLEFGDNWLLPSLLDILNGLSFS